MYGKCWTSISRTDAQPTNNSNELNVNASFWNGKLFRKQYESVGKLNWKLPVWIEVHEVKKKNLQLKKLLLSKE